MGEKRSWVVRPLWVWTAALSADGRLLALGGDGALTLWDTTTGKQVRTFPGQVSPGSPLALSPDGSLLVAGDERGGLRWLDTATGRQLWLVPAQGRVTGHRAAFSP